MTVSDQRGADGAVTVEQTIKEHLAEVPSEEAQARHLEQIRAATTMDHLARIRNLERFQTQAEFQIMNLTEQMAAVVESQKREDTEAHKTLRRRILALVLAEIMRDWNLDADDVDAGVQRMWDQLCEEVYRRYGGPELGLWTQPPAVPSDKTKALVKLFLQRRQEA